MLVMWNSCMVAIFQDGWQTSTIIMIILKSFKIRECNVLGSVWLDTTM